ncbi:MAG: urease accessory protein UreF [Phormidium sp. BM_Day4_Bin.17]|nr:urease accessory protein UreF [Phormidium sp. BM_Day4_Bin.17]UCJ12280.1 MAG: urease accessory protein UreF [Phormidium sp. PBR-2020]
MSSLLNLLQLTSPGLPLGAYNYSEGLETLVEQQQISDAAQLGSWLEMELQFGAIAVEGAILVRAYHALTHSDLDTLVYWNHWLTASRDSRELQQQSWQMGNSLLRLLTDLEEISPQLLDLATCRRELAPNCNLAIAYALAVAHWKIPLEDAILGYLHSWSSNLIGAGVKLIPLGQTSGQRLIRQLHPVLEAGSQRLLSLGDEDLFACTWGASLASMQHETLYSRLFRS